ncbi:MAG: hypothetical protein RR836_02315 [Aeromonas sp.]|uniref:hypothetical protein n=1 Tax=Aeromonas sp. TaxID=647 RepID=UPI002FC69748
MKGIIFSILLLISMSAFSDSQLNIDLAITNDHVVPAVQGVDASISYTPSNGLIKVRDGYPDFDNYDILSVGNQQGAYEVKYSLFTVNLVGKRFGHRISIKGKLIGSSIRAPQAAGSGFSSSFYNNGCATVNPNSIYGLDPKYEITASTTMSSECKASTIQQSLPYSPPIIFNGIYREFAFDLGQVIKSFEFSNAPLDIYQGSVVYNGAQWSARVSSGGPGRYAPNLNIALSLTKNSYFSGVVFTNNNVSFSIKNINEAEGVSVRGDAAVNFNLLGTFSDSDKVKLDVASTNNYRLRSTAGSIIPYSVDLEYRGARNPLVLQGNKQAPIIIEPGMMVSAINGQLTFNFKTPANLIHNGLFTDNLILIAELVL